MRLAFYSINGNVIDYAQNVSRQKYMTYILPENRRRQTENQWTKWPRKESVTYILFGNRRRHLIDRMTQDKNQWLTDCRGIGEGKRAISGQNNPGQESMTYVLSRHRRGKTDDQWTEWSRTGINDLRTAEASERENGRSVYRMTQDRNQWLTICRGIGEGKRAISGQNGPGQGSMTYDLPGHQRGQTGDQCTEWPRTGINDLRPVEASERENGRSVDRMTQDRNQWLTNCRGIREGKRAISVQNDPGQESMTYVLSRHRRGKTGDQCTEWPRTGINDLRSVDASERENGRSADRMTQDRNQWLTDCRSIGEGKRAISVQNDPGQESMTYDLPGHQRGQTGDQWTEWPRTRNQWLTDCRSIGEGKRAISGPNDPGQKSMNLPAVDIPICVN